MGTYDSVLSSFIFQALTKLFMTEVKVEGGSFSLPISIMAKFLLSIELLSEFVIFRYACVGILKRSTEASTFSESRRKRHDACLFRYVIRRRASVGESFLTIVMIFFTAWT